MSMVPKRFRYRHYFYPIILTLANWMSGFFPLIILSLFMFHWSQYFIVDTIATFPVWSQNNRSYVHWESQLSWMCSFQAYLSAVAASANNLVCRTTFIRVTCSILSWLHGKEGLSTHFTASSLLVKIYAVFLLESTCWSSWNHFSSVELFHDTDSHSVWHRNRYDVWDILIWSDYVFRSCVSIWFINCLSFYEDSFIDIRTYFFSSIGCRSHYFFHCFYCYSGCYLISLGSSSVFLVITNASLAYYTTSSSVFRTYIEAW